MRGRTYPLITQIAASVVGSAKEFSAYVYPKLPISSNAQQFKFPPTAVQNQLRFNFVKAKNLTSVHSLVGKGV